MYQPGLPVFPLFFQQWVAQLQSVCFMLLKQSLPVLLWSLYKMLLKVLYLQQQAVDLKDISCGQKEPNMY